MKCVNDQQTLGSMFSYNVLNWISMWCMRRRDYETHFSKLNSGWNETKHWKSNFVCFIFWFYSIAPTHRWILYTYTAVVSNSSSTTHSAVKEYLLLSFWIHMRMICWCVSISTAYNILVDCCSLTESTQCVSKWIGRIILSYLWRNNAISVLHKNKMHDKFRCCCCFLFLSQIYSIFTSFCCCCIQSKVHDSIANHFNEFSCLFSLIISLLF